QEAYAELLASYRDTGALLNISIIPFASANGNNNRGAFTYRADDVDDAIDYILKQGSHANDGIAIWMRNPETGNNLSTGTQYNDALYHARLTLEADVMDNNLNGYDHITYFLSDGDPNNGHSATNTGNWPGSWSSWQQFVDNTSVERPGANTDSINVI